MKKKKRKGRKIFLVLLLLLAIIAATIYYLGQRMNLLPARPGVTAESESLQTATVTRGAITRTTEGNGSIEAADEKTITADYDLKIDKVSVENGDLVSDGDLIATIDRDSVKSQIDAFENRLSETDAAISNLNKSGSDTLTSPIAGRVKRIYVESGDALTEAMATYGGVMELNPTGKLKLEIKSSKALTVGDTVTVVFLDYEESGIVTEKNGNRCTIEIDDNSNYQVDTGAEVRDSDGNVLGNGTLKTSHPYLVSANYGIVNRINVSVNDNVYAGTTLLTRTNYSYNADYTDLLETRNDLMEDLRKLRNLYEQPEIHAEGAGILSGLMLSDRAVIGADAAMYTLISTDRYWLKAQIDELDIAGVAAGQEVTIVFDAFDDAEYEGSVEKVSALGQNTGGVTTYTVTITLPGSEELKTAMSATATIIIEKKEDALMVPIEAVHTTDGKRTVIKVGSDGQQEEVEVSLGIVNNTMAEIVSGLSEGDTVISESGYSSMEQMMRMFGGSGRGYDRSSAQGGEN